MAYLELPRGFMHPTHISSYVTDDIVIERLKIAIGWVIENCFFDRPTIRNINYRVIANKRVVVFYTETSTGLEKVRIFGDEEER